MSDGLEHFGAQVANCIQKGMTNDPGGLGLSICDRWPPLDRLSSEAHEMDTSWFISGGPEG